MTVKDIEKEGALKADPMEHAGYMAWEKLPESHSKPFSMGNEFKVGLRR